MPPKNKAKKGKKVNDDDLEKSVGTEENKKSALVVGASDLDVDDGHVRPAQSGSAALALKNDDHGDNADEAHEGPQNSTQAVAAESTTSNKKDEKKSKVVGDDAIPVQRSGVDDVDAPTEQLAAGPKGPIQMTAEDLADEEWGPVNEKATKAKKGKGKKTKANEDGDEPIPALHENENTQVAHVAANLQGENEDDAPEDTGTKILSKKEKEKLKKEREKAKKRAQAASAKKVVEAEEEPAPAPPAGFAAPEPSAVAPERESNVAEDGDDVEGGKLDSKKKKKKKAAKKDEEPVPVPAASTKKKGGISALKALMEEKKRLEEEAKRREEEERLRIEEEEKRAEEEAQRKEQEKQRKKEKEKAKREQLKKEGRLLTKKEKDKMMMANIRKQALLASGVQVEGLQHATSSEGPKKVVYGNRKKKGLESKDAPAPESRPHSPQISEEEDEPEVKNGDVKDDGDAVRSDWDASSNEDKGAVAEGVKDSWEASSEGDGETEEEEEVPTAPEPKPHVPAVAAPPPKVNDAKPRAAQLASNEDKPVKMAPVAPPKKPITQAGKQKPVTTKSSSESESDSDSGDSEDDSSSSSSSEGMTNTQRLAAQKKAEAAERRAKAHEEALAARSKDDLRSPICCILGHVDTGKTKLLDKIRQTNVQEGEAGGITQQIGATYFPVDAIQQKTAVLNADGKQEYKIPGLLVIDTPGHESFTNLRSRGSSLCNIAILVVDILHGLEPQTLESLRLLRDRKTPFIVALNKIDRLYGWEPTPDGAFQESLAKQKSAVKREFADRVGKTIVAFAEQGLNATLYYENKNLGRNVSLVPTSAITGEGVPDMIMLLVNLTQQRMSDRLMYLSELECTVLEVKMIDGLGTTIDVILSNGILQEGDKIVVCGLNGPIVTQVRALLTPQPLRELRIKSAYVHHKEVKAALGVKIVAPELEKAIAGSRLLVVGPDDDEDELREEVMSDLNSIQTTERGVCVQASTLGSLEALLDFLKVSKIPVSGVSIGPVHKKDVMRAATMLEKAKELACILCFDVPIDKDTEKLAEEMGIRLFKADIIYHLFDAFTAYNNELMEARRRDAAPQAIWPCRLKIIAAFCKRDPIILGVDILEGSLRVGTPLAVVKIDPVSQKKEIVDLGKITSLEINHKPRDIVKKAQAGGGVAVKIEHAVYQSAKMFGRHFDDKDEVLSHITRQSIDVLKNSFKADVTTEEWLLIKALKPRFNIV